MTPHTTIRSVIHRAGIASALLAGFVLAISSQAAFAQQQPKKPAPKSTAKPAAKSSAKPAAAAAAPAAAGLSAEQLNIAQYVNTGRFPCELGGSVTVSPVSGSEGYFSVSGNGRSYRMVPVPTTTGAIRLEDKRAGGVWLVLANKSMLLDQGRGQRIADECQNDQQRATAEQLRNSSAPTILDGPTKK
jgi:hypothetical protein